MRRYLANALSVASLVQLVALALVWLIMTEAIGGSWFIGLPVILLVVIFLSESEDQSDMHQSLSALGLAAFLPFFLWQSVVSGFDVALRALRRDMGLRPALLRFPMSLAGGAARRLFINSITLMPGTLSVMVEGDTVLVHVLDARQPVTSALERLETRAGAVFGVTLKHGRE